MLGLRPQEILTLGHWTSAPGTVITKCSRHHTHACKNISKECFSLDGKKEFISAWSYARGNITCLSWFSEIPLRWCQKHFPAISSGLTPCSLQCVVVAPAGCKQEYWRANVGWGSAASCCEDRVFNQMWSGPWWCMPIISARGSQAQLQPELCSDTLQCSSPKTPSFQRTELEGGLWQT